MTRSATHKRTRSPRAARGGSDELLRARIEVAHKALERDRILTGRKTHRVSGRIDPGLIRAAMERSGIKAETALVEAALTLLAEPDDYALWLISQRGQLDKDFELVL
jgi:Arc/MetJ family transcription regulator